MGSVHFHLSRSSSLSGGVARASWGMSRSSTIPGLSMISRHIPRPRSPTATCRSILRPESMARVSSPWHHEDNFSSSMTYLPRATLHAFAHHIFGIMLDASRGESPFAACAGIHVQSVQVLILAQVKRTEVKVRTEHCCCAYWVLLVYLDESSEQFATPAQPHGGQQNALAVIDGIPQLCCTCLKFHQQSCQLRRQQECQSQTTRMQQLPYQVRFDPPSIHRQMNYGYGIRYIRQNAFVALFLEPLCMHLKSGA